MTYYANNSIPERLSQAEDLIKTVSFDDMIRSRLAARGYTEDQFAEMQQLLDNAQRLETNQQVQLGKQAAATNVLEDLTQAIRMKFVGDRRFTRFVLKGNEALIDELRLRILTKRGREALVRQMRHFYEEVVRHEELMATLSSTYNLTAELFAARLAEISALRDAVQAQQYQIGQVRVATQQRREAMQELDAWMSAFIGMARQAFRDEEESLRKLRIHVKAKTRIVPPVDEAES